MSGPETLATPSSWGPRLQSVLRIVAGLLFLLSGTAKLFGYPTAADSDGSTVPLMSQLGVAGILEVVGGTLMMIGLFARPVAFILSGMMAVAYFQVHFPAGFWPTTNGGVPAVLYCFIWLFFSAAGAGPWSLDAMRRK